MGNYIARVALLICAGARLLLCSLVGLVPDSNLNAFGLNRDAFHEKVQLWLDLLPPQWMIGYAHYGPGYGHCFPDAYLRSAPLDLPNAPPVSLTESGLAVVPPDAPVMVVLPVFKSGTGAGPPKIMTSPVLFPAFLVICCVDSGCGLMEPFDPMWPYAPARLVVGFRSD